MVQDIALRRLRLMAVPQQGAVTAEAKVIGLADLANLGYRVTNPDLWNDSVFRQWMLSTIPTLTAMRGGDVKYAPLFPGFPDEIPSHRNVRIDEALYVVRAAVPSEIFVLLLESLGEEATRWLRVSSIPQDPKRTAREVERQEQKDIDSHTEWVDLTLAPADEVDGELLEWLRDVLYAPTSMKDAQVADVMSLLVHFGLGVVDTEEVTFLETRSVLLQLMWETNALAELRLADPGPTELLRLFARLTDTDVSLLKEVRFPRMSKLQRRTVLACIDDAPNAVEDLFRYRNLWLRVAEYLHPGQYAKRYPRAYDAFTQLRNNRRNAGSFEARVEALLGDTTTGRSDILALLVERPTLFSRRLRKLLVDAGGQGAPAVLDAFAEVAQSVPPKALLTLRTHLATVEDHPRRAIINRGGSIRVVDSPPDLPAAVKSAALDVVDGAVDAALSASPSWRGQTAWIDPELHNYVAPLQQRKVSDGMLNIARGTRLPLDTDKVLRMFLYWLQPPGRRSDLDLSAVMFDRNLKYVGHVDWTRLRGRGMSHSGDLTSAPAGATELLDIRLDALGGDVRYVAPQVYRYAGPSFPELLRAHVGWMVRSHSGAEAAAKAFDIATVQDVFDLSSRSAYAVPFVADISEQQIIYTDLYVGSRQAHNRVLGNENTLSEICQAVRLFTSNRLTLHELVRRNVEARGATLVTDRSKAGLTFGVDADCLFHAQDVAAINAHLLG